MAARSGLTVDTLRWYEKEGLLPAVPRGADGRRRYEPGQQSVVLLLTSLRRTGMSTHDMKLFVSLLAEGAASHARRIQLLEANRQRLDQRRAEIEEASRQLDVEIQHYRDLIAQGLDCDGAPVPAGLRSAQAAPFPPQAPSC